MSGDDVDLITLDLTGEDNLRLPSDDPFPQLGGHPLGVVGIQIEFLGDLLIREVQPHEVQALDPDPQRLVMSGEDRPGQVVEAAAAGPALWMAGTPSAEDERHGVLYRTNELPFHLRKASENGVSRDAILEAL
jgi:hypothetical protein